MIKYGVRQRHESCAFDATTSLFNYGALNDRFNTNRATTILGLCRPAGAGENNFGYLFGRGTTATVGLRLFLDDTASNPRWRCGLTSTTALSPFRNCSNNTTPYGRWYWVAMTSKGTLTAADIHIYQATVPGVLAELGYTDSGDGTGTLTSNSGQDWTVGNREDSARTFNGDIAMVARWDAELSLTDLQNAIRYGPMSIRRQDLIFVQAGRRELVSNFVPTVTGFGIGQSIPYPIKTETNVMYRSLVLLSGGQVIDVTGISSLEAFGSHTIAVGAVTIACTGIASTEAFGTHTITTGAVTVTCSGIASDETFGTHTVVPGAVTIVCSGIATLEAFGDAIVSAGGSVISCTGIATAEAFGSHTVVPGGVSIICTGIATLEAFGDTIVSQGAQIITASGIATLEAFGSASIQVGAVTIVCTGIASLEVFGAHIVTGGASEPVTTPWIYVLPVENRLYVLSEDARINVQ